MAGAGELIQGSIGARSLTAAQQVGVCADLTVRPVAEGVFVCRRGEPVEQWLGVVDGLLKISSVSAKGKAVTFTGVPPGRWFGEGSLLKADP